jgi:hypothetical protein
MVWGPLNIKPASGIPASGIPAGGPGWGGAATGTKNKPLQGAGPGRGHVDPARVERRERMMGVLLEIAEKGAQESARVAAANAVLDRIDGKPAQTQINATPEEAAAMGYVVIPPKKGDV